VLPREKFACVASENACSQVVYVDPVHDFAFIRVDVSKLERTEPIALPLEPAGARIGVEIRLVGADAGERLQVLQGTISRVDRMPPDYNAHTYR
jgi:S1-C subfamily serine protease